MIDNLKKHKSPVVTQESHITMKKNLAQDAPSSIVVKDPGLYPECIEWDAEGGRFLITSLTRGTITGVFDDGTFNVFIKDEGGPVTFTDGD